MATHSGIHSSRGRRREAAAPSALRITGDTAAATSASRAAQAGPDVAALAQATVEGREQQRRARIERAAYLRAERRGFAPGHEVEDWLAAEAEVTAARADGTLPAD